MTVWLESGGPRRMPRSAIRAGTGLNKALQYCQVGGMLAFPKRASAFDDETEIDANT